MDAETIIILAWVVWALGIALVTIWASLLKLRNLREHKRARQYREMIARYNAELVDRAVLRARWKRGNVHKLPRRVA